MNIEKILKEAAKKVYRFKHPSIISFMVFETINAIINTRLGAKILHSCAKHDFYNVFEFFVKYDANVDVADRKG